MKKSYISKFSLVGIAALFLLSSIVPQASAALQSRYSTVKNKAAAADTISNSYEQTVQNPNIGSASAGSKSYEQMAAVNPDIGATDTGSKSYEQMAINPNLGNPDNTMPDVQITSPAANDVVKGMVTITADATDNVGVAKVEFYADDNLINTIKQAPYKTQWDSTKADDGTVTLQASADDKAGNNRAHSIKVKVQNMLDAGPATIQMIYPTANDEVKGKFDIKVDARGGGGAKSVKVDYFVNNGWKSVGSSNAPQGTVFTIPWDSTVAPDGDTHLSVGGDHKDGTTSFVNIKIHVENKVDMAKPSIAIVSPQPNASIHDKQNIFADASDDVAVTDVKYYADGNLFGPTVVNQGDYTHTYVSLDTMKLADGPVKITAEASDKVGNTTTSSAVTVNINNHGDKTPPTVKILSPIFNQSFNLGMIPISADAQDETALDRVEFYGEQNVFIDKKTTAPFDVTWDTNASNTQQGLASIRVVAYDKAGNSAEAKQTIVLVNPKFHSVKIAANPADGATVHGKFDVTADCNPANDVDHVSFTWLGQQEKTINGGNPYVLNWDLTGQPDGDIELLMVAMDKGGGYLGELQVTYHIQNP